MGQVQGKREKNRNVTDDAESSLGLLNTIFSHSLKLISLTPPLLLLSISHYKILGPRPKEKLKFEAKEEYFIRNGAVLLEKQIALSRGQDTGSMQLKIYSAEDMHKATKCFHADLIIGCTVHCNIYKGTLMDQTLAIKAPREVKAGTELVNLLLTEAATAVVMNHPNLVRIYGCCIETDLPILVYELFPSKILCQRLHGGIASEKGLIWAGRLRVASDVSYALSYMHNALSRPVVHRDIHTYGILLDDSFHAKLANLSYSMAVNPGEESQKSPIQGTPGYIDPEYVKTQEVTAKCDVYNFGVLMLELLTGRQPLVVAREGSDFVDMFVSSMNQNSIMEMIDKKVIETGKWDEIQQFIQLALKCVAEKGTQRPNMVEIVSELWRIQGRENK